MTKCRWGALLVTVLLICLPLLGQESTVKGNLSGVVLDQSGAVVVGAKATLNGPQGSKSVTSESDGRFAFPLLTPGMYSVKVEKQGFRTIDVGNVEVATGKTANVTVTLQPGATTETVEVTGTAVTVDTSSTAVGASLPDTFYQSVPVARNVASLFYVAPGAADGGGTGRSNPSVSGASGLENLYVADGVNITDSAFGGLGVFTRRQGSIGSGINLSFIKEVNVKTSGFEPQYGQADGGVIQLVTKSGTNHYHGEIGAYFAPAGAQAGYLQTDPIRTNKNGFYNGNDSYDIDGELGGPVPGFKDHLFFFGSFDPTWNRQYMGAAFIDNNGTPSGLRNLYPNGITLFNRVLNYAGKLTWKINDNHSVESSVFGDPTHTNTGPWAYVGLNSPNNTSFSHLTYGTRNFVVRYNGTLSPTWLLNGSFTWGNNNATEFPAYPDVLSVVNRPDARHISNLQGLGFYENHDTNNYGYNIDTQKIVHAWGTHTFSIGYRYERPNYNDFETATGGRFAVPLTNASGGDYTGGCSIGDPTCPLGQTVFLWSGSIRPASASCTLCPIYNFPGIGPNAAFVQFNRGDFNPSDIPTYGRYHAAYLNDSWQIGSRVTLSLGYRWEQWRMVGTDVHYTFTDNWAPRFGVSVDPFGDRKTKIFGNYARYNYQTPLDAAIRSLSAEKDLLALRFAPASTGGVVDVNPNGSINVPIDSAHLLNLATGGSGGTAVIGASLTGFASGAKMQFQDEFSFGTEHEFKGGLVLSGRFIYRTIPRALDDVSGVSPEGYVYGLTQNYFISNPSPSLDLYPNENESSFPGSGPPPDGCGLTTDNGDGTFNVHDVNGGTINPGTGGLWNNGNGICWMPDANGFLGGEIGPQGQPIPDGIPDGFPKIRHIYKAVELELNKSFSHNWMLRANWRIASLTGNYEGAYRNDNGQTDPNISSLFDFTNGIANMLGDQYAIGPLNTDRRHIINIYTSWVIPKTFLKNTEVGGGVNILSGVPLNKLGNHPAYANAGEIPLGGRGAQGRTPISGGVNLHVDRPFKVTEKSNLHLTADLFNLSNGRPVVFVDQNYQISNFPDLNPDFLKPSATAPLAGGAYQRPFYARFAVRWTF
jgi:hypothetical protein